ncbi:MAG: 3-oxoacyl-[acyl-carrier-protein] reductase [Deltaproteobacteria bacterium]|nr:3-oxoacyl-[acyl-carrier-protein] reductase [Deltaproteobacteria bacterium]MBW2018869.1 3-oxoacyl-[acyl-carrier-protein] reductase [Deltaproteobacteria bacterium]MBW2073624.1 3-oxoacyl-[acyl-carrier-protein] reductase [Deltaproteobacteria bacterium]RLB81949.1 MAG: 3-oxoacyl-[acyl-carrier-protein] reductase [Deltaproteobacteria bacterium]
MTNDKKRVVVITGGSRGIGRAIGLRMADADTIIYFNYSSRNSQDAEETVRLVEEAGGSARAACVNVASQQEVQGFFNRIIEESGRVDVLVNNAGITIDGLLLRMKEADWDRVLAINLKGAFHCIQAVAKTMMKQRTGRIINMASVVGVMGNAGQANYVASKAGLIGLTKTAARELAPRGITVNAVAPGFIDTPMTAPLAEKVKEAMLAQIPLGRFGQPQDVAEVVAFLASDRASYITGQVIHVNGGMYM